MAEEGRIEVERRRGTPAGIERVGEEGRQEGGVSFRAIAFGLCLSVAANLLTDTVRYVQKGSYMTYSQMPMANLIPFMASILGCAALARCFGLRFVFSPTEWIAIFCMGFMAAQGPAYGVSGYMIGMMVAPYYFATPENQWATYLQPYLPTWLIPTNEGEAITYFFEGLPKGASIPWGIWAVPLLWWFMTICVLVFACICVSVVIHRQWSDHEKLVYPAITPVLEMTTHAGMGERLLPEFMKGRAFWAGFILISFVFGWNMISWFYPYIPTFPTASGTWFPLPRKYPPLWVFLSTFVICFSYFASLEVLFSIWFFDLLFTLQAGALNRLGMAATGYYTPIGSFKLQTAGAFVALVLWWLWVARLHLRDVFRKALRPDRSPIDDSRELLSYRVAFIGLFFSCLYIAFWVVLKQSAFSIQQSAVSFDE